MIVSRKRRFVYISPPRTASTTLHRWLSQPALCEVRWTADRNDQHDMKIPATAAGYFSFASIRHPCARAVSLWAHGQTATELVFPVPKMHFVQFVRDWLPTAWWFYGGGQAEYLDGLHLDALVPASCRSPRSVFLCRPPAGALARGPPVAGVSTGRLAVARDSRGLPRIGGDLRSHAPVCARAAPPVK